MRTEIVHCDLCQKAVKGPGVSRPVTGVVVDMGYSKGGWGYRQQHVKWRGEVCDTCYTEYETIARATALWLKKRNGVRAPEIIIDEHEVTVRTDKA